MLYYPFSPMINFSCIQTPLIHPNSLEQNIGIIVASMPALRQLFTMRKQPCSSHSSETPCIQHNNTRPPLNPLARLSDSDLFRVPDDNTSTKTSSLELSTLTSGMSDIEKCHDTRVSMIRLSTVSPPLWTERKISSAERVEMSRVSPTPTLVSAFLKRKSPNQHQT